ncbi:phage tail protein [Clostridium tyrobutyricum]|uniref:Phage-related protein n=1 Tax=Clostridium tyrobutyricum DIVETGP TaxID=1408889 RepID=W6N7H4_CLOTY|nr:distal tail protein Dit [Clostridium tyrobutyricum]AND85559.1 phage-related protein [Clostridium tyrobutyricum]ANP70089.1 phage tail protein [Clostridium tyrobutyricum]MBV4434435.1 phage tail family protein [Clostridium tyrobutyricum]QNB65550.1 phage tail protein [Clostridium tyrobutyricum]CDL92461.1 Phage-related protein [Clostridium tyrobutyricum DIVETGP]
MLSFNFGGRNSYDDFGILIAKRPDLPSPKRRVNIINIPGRNSNLRFDEKTYDDITLTVECSVKDTQNLADKIDDIAVWLFEAGEGDLTFSFQPDKKYIAQVVNAIDFKQVYKYFSEFPIIFNCRPFKYAVENNIVIINTSCAKVTNPGTIESEPVISIYGSGDIVFKINGQQISLKGVSEKIIVDSVIQDCYDNAGNNLNGKMTGEFPKLKPGENIMEWSGDVVKAELLPNWRWL